MQLSQMQPAKCCLLIIDVQEKLMNAIDGKKEVIETTALMIEVAKIFDLPILPMTQYKKGLGGYVEEIETLVEGIPQFDKMEFNVVANPAVAEAITTLGSEKETLILVGVESHICVLQTALGLLEMGKNVCVVSDAVSSRNKMLHEAGLKQLRQEGAIVGPAEMFIYQMIGKAGTPEFKKILPHIVARDKRN